MGTNTTSTGMQYDTRVTPPNQFHSGSLVYTVLLSCLEIMECWRLAPLQHTKG